MSGMCLGCIDMLKTTSKFCKILSAVFLALSLVFLPAVPQIFAVSPETFNATATFTTPTGIYAVGGECRGGGGGGSTNGSAAARPGGGGGGGAYSKTNSIAVTPGQGYTVTVGAAVAAEVAGNQSSFTGNSSQTVVAAGGSRTIDRTGAAGGVTTSPTVGDTKFAGGVGGTAANTGNNGGGGGGEGGRSNATGGAGQPNSAATGGNGGTGGDGGDGGKGGNNSAAGLVGVAPGGGGGGAGGNINTAGGGAAGQCIITYTDTWAPSVSLTTSNSTWTYATAPNQDSTSQISMTATTGFDYTGPIMYTFTLDNSTCGSNAGTGGTSSSAQSSTSYSDSGLQVNKCYGYKVISRDSAGIPNTGAYSSIATAYTSANTPGTPTLGSPGLTTLSVTNAENSNPASNPTTNFAVQVVTTSPSDATWLNKWIDASGNPSATAVWQTDAALDAIVLQGLESGTTYGVKVKARNQDSDETALSAEGQATTTAAVVSVTVTTDGSIAYGTLSSADNKSTIQLSDTQTAQNDGNVAEDFNIKTSAATGGTGWTLGAAAGSNIFVHEFSTNSGGNWTKFTTADSYQTLITNIAASGTQNFDLRFTAPNPSSDVVQKTITITIQAVQH